MLVGVSSVANSITAYEESQLNRDSHFLICRAFFVSKGNLFDVYFIEKTNKQKKKTKKKKKTKQKQTNKKHRDYLNPSFMIIN